MLETYPLSVLEGLRSRTEALRTIAIMEDVEVIARFVRRQLSAENYNVLLAHGASDCEILAAHGCRTFILDIDMGEGRSEEGLSVLSRLKLLYPRIFCILLTNHRDLRKAALDLGCDAFLNKSGTDLRLEFDQIWMALDRMWLGQATSFSFDPAHRPKADEMVRCVEGLRRDQAADDLDDPEKRSLMARYHELTEKKFCSGLSDQDIHSLEAVTKALEEFELVEANEIDRRNADGRVGRLDADLDRIGELLREWKAAKG